MAERTIEYVVVDDLIPAERNPKLHDDVGIERSIATLGFTAPAVIDERTGRLVEGHGRRSALIRLRENGAEPPDGIVADGQVWRTTGIRQT